MEESLMTLVRTIFAYFFVLFITRLLGRKALSHMTISDFISAIILGEITALLAVEGQRSVSALVALVAFGSLAIVADFTHIKSFAARKLFDSEPIVLIENGKIVEQNLRKARVTLNEMNSILRQKNVFNISDVEFAILENDGEISVQFKSQKQPLTPSDLQIPTKYLGLTKDIIIDGEVMQENLMQTNLDINWLKRELNRFGINNPSEVFYAGLDTSGNLYISEKRKRVEIEGEYGIE
ncbi:DUF421 domain-containing protein [Heliobacterium chlorum]|uniref:DUF421 domain-containing protein n=1 Tax=Heliobacterium chlorum TaxID=2698 RepID=A0ABR7T7C6_HELCL|nr:DUF421 domain-containing protein [Heliobacterium chlorum]MBC9786678.1 DUF421 domain-containing protein [Heliobacterium chlorum]